MAEKKVPVEEMLRIRGLKATPQRVAIYCIMSNLGHASADMVAKRMEEKYGSITLATVYNVLDSLAKAGMIQQRMSLNNKMYYDINTYDHCHLYNIEDNTIADYDDPELINLVRDYLASKKITNFDLDRVDIQLLGKLKQRRKRSNLLLR